MNNDRFKYRVAIRQEDGSYKVCDVGLIFYMCEKIIVEYGYVEDANHGKVGKIVIDGENAILLLCTGLKDENGKLIFEGDVISYELGFYTVRAIVKWDDERAVFALDFGRGIPTNYAKVPSGRVNVIGNIHEKEFDK